MTKAILIVILLLSLLVPVSILLPVSAAPEEVKWEKVNIPAAGETGGWVLAPGSDVKHLTMANDGTLYACANPTGTNSVLFKSTDRGVSWTATGNIQGIIAAIATASDDASTIYYATTAGVFKSVDAGKVFIQLPAGPGGAGTGNITITSLSVARLSGKSVVAIGTTDNDSAQFGGIYTLDESKPVPGWEDAVMGNNDVAALAFAPNYASNRQLVAVVTDETDTFVTSRVGVGGWNQTIGKATITGRAAKFAAIVFPDGYDVSDMDSKLLIGLDTGSSNGDVFKITTKAGAESSIAADLNAGSADNLNNLDISGLAVNSSNSTFSLLAGAAASTRIYISTDNGTTWTRSRKEPTGQSRTYLLTAPDFATSNIAYAATSGLDSALSYSTDGGKTWNQISLLDTRISSNGIIDLAVSPDYSRDNTLFMLTFDGVSTKHSLWRSWSGGVGWERVFAGTMPNVDTLGQIELIPKYSVGNQTVFIAGTSNSTPALWKSTDGGQTFRYRSTPSAFSPAQDPWTVVDNDNLIFGGFNGANGLVYSTDDGGISYSSGVNAGSQRLKSIAVSPDFKRDQTILVGNSSGWVYYSSDNGSSFKQLPLDSTIPPLTGTVMVAFDPDFVSNKTIYATSNTANKGVYRFVIGKSAKWERIDTTLPASGALGRLTVSAEGTLYAVNSQSVNATVGKGGMERSLNPGDTQGPTFETVIRGLDDVSNLSGLWLQGGQLWTIDTQNTAVMTFVDSLAKPAGLTIPADNMTGTGTSNILLKWEALKGATQYEWQMDYDNEFSAVPANFEGTTQASSVKLPSLDADTTYHWRVRAIKPILSPWSKESSFTTGLGSAVVAPELYSPKAGAEGVSLKPLFQWSAIAGASSYEFMLSNNVSFNIPLIAKIGIDAIPATAWQNETSLDYNTAYYWKVRASGNTSHSDWSAVGAFITQTTPVSPPTAADLPTTPEQPQPTPALPSQLPTTPVPSSPPITVNVPPAPPALPGWFPVVLGGVVLGIVLLGVAVLILVLKVRRTS